MDKYTVRAFIEMEVEPINECHFNTMDECEEWCRKHCEVVRNLEFEIHHSLGASNYRHGIASGTGLITWIDKDYSEEALSGVTPWWTIYEIPEEVDQMCKEIVFYDDQR
jgi:hypothetical protein